MDGFSASQSDTREDQSHTFVFLELVQVANKKVSAPRTGLVDFQGRVQTSLAGCVDVVSPVEKLRIWARQTLAGLQVLLFSQLVGAIVV